MYYIFQKPYPPQRSIHTHQTPGAWTWYSTKLQQTCFPWRSHWDPIWRYHGWRHLKSSQCFGNYEKNWMGLCRVRGNINYFIVWIFVFQKLPKYLRRSMRQLTKKVSPAKKECWTQPKCFQHWKIIKIQSVVSHYCR